MSRRKAPQPLPESFANYSMELLQALHIATRDGKLNQDSQRKLKQVAHLVQFIEPLMAECQERDEHWSLVDHGAGKSYLGFLLVDQYMKKHAPEARVYGVESRFELVEAARDLAARLSFDQMSFHHMTVEISTLSEEIPPSVDIVTALHACDTATDDAITFALSRRARHVALVPCCQAEVASHLRAQKNPATHGALGEMWRHRLHTREFGSHLTNVLRCLRLEAHGYRVRVTELVGWEHSMKNELIIATRLEQRNGRSARRLLQLLELLGLEELKSRFDVPNAVPGENSESEPMNEPL